VTGREKERDASQEAVGRGSQDPGRPQSARAGADEVIDYDITRFEEAAPAVDLVGVRPRTLEWVYVNKLQSPGFFRAPHFTLI
jgi:hypothetical protein